MIRLARTLLLAIAVLPTPAFAQTTSEPTEVADSVETGPPAGNSLTVSGGATLTSQYRFRGISLSDEGIALQGTVNLSHDGGFYAGAWASTLDGFGERGGANVELDLYAGYSTPISSGVMLDAGLLYYAFPGSSGGKFEFFEPYASLSGTLGPASAKVGVAYAFDQDALGGESNIYAFGDLTAGLPGSPITFKAHLGFSKGDTRLSPRGDYFDWLFGTEYARRNLKLGVSYVDTDLTARQAALGGASKDIVDQAILLSATLSF